MVAFLQNIFSHHTPVKVLQFKFNIILSCMILVSSYLFCIITVNSFDTMQRQ